MIEGRNSHLLKRTPREKAARYDRTEELLREIGLEGERSDVLDRTRELLVERRENNVEVMMASVEMAYGALVAKPKDAETH